MPTAHRPFRFGLQVSKAADAKSWADLARKSEDLGYATFTMPDHFSDQLAPIPALVAAADATTTLRVGMLVLDNDYRHPVVLAKEAATLDLLSDGRLELGLGAGWERTDYEMSGIAYDSPGTRIDRFLEGLTIVRGLFAGGPYSFEGEHYTITGLDGTPKPVQSHVPLLIGGGGPRMLALAAREADIVGVNFDLRSGAVDAATTKTGTAAEVDKKIDIIRAAAGNRFDDLELNIRVFVNVVTDDRDGMAERLAPGFGVTPADALEIPFALVGTTAQIVETIRARRERWGFSYVIFGADDIDRMAPVVAELAGT
jgi:probable F420-dependent oxidoreductase